MRPKWSLGPPKMTQKWTKVGPRARSGTTCEKWLKERGVQGHFGLHFGANFWSKNESKTGVKNTCILDGVLVAFCLIWSSILDPILALFQLWRPKNGDRVKMWKWARRRDETLIYVYWRDPKSDKEWPKTGFWTRRCGDTFVDHHLGTFGRILGSKNDPFL